MQHKRRSSPRVRTIGRPSFPQIEIFKVDMGNCGSISAQDFVKHGDVVELHSEYDTVDNLELSHHSIKDPSRKLSNLISTREAIYDIASEKLWKKSEVESYERLEEELSTIQGSIDRQVEILKLQIELCECILKLGKTSEDGLTI